MLLRFDVLLRNTESCAYPDSDPRTAIVVVFDLSETHILRRCLEACVLQEMERHLSPASYRACSAKQLSLDSVSLCIQEHACDDLACVLAKTIKCTQLLKNRENEQKWWVDYTPNTVLCFWVNTAKQQKSVLAHTVSQGLQ